MNLVTLAALVAPLALSPQDPETAAPAAPAARADGPPVLELSDLSLGHFTPQHSDPRELERLVSRMVGRHFYVVERGGMRSEPIANLSLLGREIVLYDTQEYVARLKTTLEKLDALGELRERPSRELVTRQYRPRHVSLQTATEAVRSLTREHPDRSMNLSSVVERRTLVLHDTEVHVTKMEEVLLEIDRPEEQVLVTSYLLRGTSGEAGSGGARRGPEAPSELLAGLEALLPGMQFESLGIAMLRTAVVANRPVELSLAGHDGTDFEIRFIPQAYDTDTGNLTVESCTVNRRHDNRRVLSTNTVFRGDEYTVLGATGADPVFVVVHVRSIS
jgi:hypothetical protein